MRSAKFWLAAAVLTLPAFGLMLRPGIFTMHDPHVFRVQQFDLCAREGIFPCRWSPDSSKGYGSPLFNFYAQAPYWLAQAFITVGLSILDSTKAAFVFSLAASALAMFFFARRLWGNWGGLLSAVFYVYAPYRAVDVWVRGALPEALAFVWYPLLLLCLDDYLQSKKTVSLLGFSVCLAGLIITHNLSFLMFAPFLAGYWLFRCRPGDDLKTFTGLLAAGLYALALTSWYLLPVVTESSLVTLQDTIGGYYDYRIHFTTLQELFISRYWGYGASLWARKFLSVSIGHLHWILPLALLLPAMFRFRRGRYQEKLFLLLTGFGVFALFLTHGRSVFIWNRLPQMAYIQFPWRFLTSATVFLSLAAGYVATLLPGRRSISLLIVGVILLNVGFYRPDIWRNITDRDITSGPWWDENRSTSLTDFWPKSAPHPPDRFAPENPVFVSGSGSVTAVARQVTTARYDLAVATPAAVMEFPVVYFPGWQADIDGQPAAVSPGGRYGLVTLPVSPGRHVVTLSFTNTLPRTAGNLVSLGALFMLPVWFLRKRLG